MNRTSKKWVAIIVISAIVGISIFLYAASLYLENAFLSLGGNPFWTSIQGDSRELVIISQGETKTFPVELHFWKRLNTLLGIELEEPEAEQGGLYNPPDGLEISFNLDHAFVKVSNEKVVEMLVRKDVEVKELSQIEYRFEGVDMVVAEEIGNITISVSKDVPVDDYYFGIATTDANVNSRYGGTSHPVTISVVANGTGLPVQD